MHRLQKDFGVEANALHWFTTFITGRTQRVCIEGNSSDPHQLICGVPQGSVLGVRMYTMYTQMLANVIRKHDVQHHSFTDDTQVYVRCDDNEDARSAAIVKLETCIMTFGNHVSNICRSTLMNIRKIRQIRKYLTCEAVKTLVQCTVTVRLDYCNSLYCGLPFKDYKETEASPEFRSTTHRQDNTARINFTLYL